MARDRKGARSKRSKDKGARSRRSKLRSIEEKTHETKTTGTCEEQEESIYLLLMLKPREHHVRYVHRGSVCEVAELRLARRPLGPTVVLKTYKDNVAFVNELHFLERVRVGRVQDSILGEYLPLLLDSDENNLQVVETAVGPSLVDVRDELPNRSFRHRTAIYLAHEALREVHTKFKTVHTNVRLEHFCIGARFDRNCIYIVSFSRHHNARDGAERVNSAAPEPSNYSAREPTSLQPLVDIEAWLYCVIEIFDKNAVPWTKKPDIKPEDLMKWKKAVFKDPEGRLEKLPPEVAELVRLVNTKNFDVDAEEGSGYEAVATHIEAMAKTHGVKMDGRCEWEKEMTGRKNAVPSKGEVKQIAGEVQELSERLLKGRFGELEKCLP